MNQASRTARGAAAPSPVSPIANFVVEDAASVNPPHEGLAKKLERTVLVVKGLHRGEEIGAARSGIIITFQRFRISPSPHDKRRKGRTCQ